MLPADLAGAVVLASVVAVDPRGWYPFVVAKFAAVSIAVVVAWWVAISDRGSVLDRRVVVAFTGLLVVLSIAALVGRDPLYAWVGTPERHLGVVTWVLAGAALATGSRLADIDRLVRFSRWVVASGLVLGAYAYVERWHPPIATSADTVRLGGPYGSASFLGAALCLILPVCVAGCVALADRRWRSVAAVATALGTAALIGSGTRAAWAAIAAVGLVVVGARARTVLSAGGPPMRRLALPLVAVTVGFVLSIGTNPSVATRTNGASSRIDDWRVGWRIVAAHPWLGVGPEGYRTALADGVSATYERTYGRSPLPDRAHNVLIDVAAAGGVGAAVLFAIVAALVSVAAWRSLRGGAALRCGLAAAAIAYLAQQWFLFPVATIDPIFWLFAGVLVASPASAVRDVRSNAGATMAVPVVAALVGGALGVGGVLAIAADRAARQAVDSGSQAAARRAVELRPDVARYWLLAAELQPTSIAGLDAAIDDVEHAVRLTPNDPIVAMALADERLQKAIATGERADAVAAVASWRGLTDRDRACYECHLGMGYAHAMSGDLAAARDAFRRASVLAPVGVTEAQDRVDELATLAAEPGTDPDG